MEAQVTFSLWLVLKDFPQGWSGGLDQRAGAIQALHLSQLPVGQLTRTKHGGREVLTARFPEGIRIGTNALNKPWTPEQWKNILKQAAGFSKKELLVCTEVEEWVWWCYPVFRRYWMTRGLRFTGSKHKGKPPLEGFALRVALPERETTWGYWGGLLFAQLFVTEKKP